MALWAIAPRLIQQRRNKCRIREQFLQAGLSNYAKATHRSGAVPRIAWLGAGRDIVGVNELGLLSEKPLQEAIGIVKDWGIAAKLDVTVLE